MKTDINDPWSRTDTEGLENTGDDNRFEDSFVEKSEHEKLSDSEQYLQKLCT